LISKGVPNFTRWCGNISLCGR